MGGLPSMAVLFVIVALCGCAVISTSTVTTYLSVSGAMTIPKMASVIGRCLVLLLCAGLGMAAGLLEEQSIDLRLVEPSLAADSEWVTARGFPHAWLVSDPQPPGVPELSRRIANRQLLMSLFFWLAASTIALSAVRAIWHRFSRRPRLSAPMGLRLFAAWSTAGCAATYGYLFTGMFSYGSLLLATAIGVTAPFVIVRSWGDSAIRRLGALIAILVALTAGAALAISSESGLGILVFLIGVYFLASIVIALLLLHWLAPVCRWVAHPFDATATALPNSGHPT